MALLSSTSTGLALGTVVDRKYRIERLLGRGGMGEVYLAHHAQLGRLVALKTVRTQALALPDLRARFQREAMAVARLSSEHIAQVFDVGELSDGSPYMVMEFLEGMDLAAVLQQGGPLPVAEVLGYLQQACAGVAIAHAAGIVHRDLKPANLFLVSRPSGPLLKILDFGIAKAPRLMSGVHTHVPVAEPGAPRTNLTHTDMFLGSVHYMAPEQMESARDVDARADLWSLGVVGYRLLTGRHPFAGERPEEVLLAVVHTRPEPLTALRPDVPPALAQILDGCLQIDPARRWSSAGLLQQALASVTMPSFSWSTAAGQHASSSDPRLLTDVPGYPSSLTEARHGGRVTAPSALPPTLAMPRSRSRTAALVALLVCSGASALIALLLGARASGLLGSGPDAAASATTSEPFVTPFPVADLHHVDPSELLPMATNRARAVDSTARLRTIYAIGAREGSLDLSGSSSILKFEFQTAAGQAVNVLMLETNHVKVHNDSLGNSSLGEGAREPRCSLAQAWAALVRAGKTPEPGGMALYSTLYEDHETWSLPLPQVAGGNHLVNGQTCALEGPAHQASLSGRKQSSAPAPTSQPVNPSTSGGMRGGKPASRSTRLGGDVVDPWAKR